MIHHLDLPLPGRSLDQGLCQDQYPDHLVAHSVHYHPYHRVRDRDQGQDHRDHHEISTDEIPLSHRSHQNGDGTSGIHGWIQNMQLG